MGADDLDRGVRALRKRHPHHESGADHGSGCRRHALRSRRRRADMMTRAAWRTGGASGTVAAVTVLGLFLTSAGNATGQLLALELLGRDADRVSAAGTAEPDGYTD